MKGGERKENHFDKVYRISLLKSDQRSHWPRTDEQEDLMLVYYIFRVFITRLSIVTLGMLVPGAKRHPINQGILIKTRKEFRGLAIRKKMVEGGLTRPGPVHPNTLLTFKLLC